MNISVGDGAETPDILSSGFLFREQFGVLFWVIVKDFPEKVISSSRRNLLVPSSSALNLPINAALT